MYTQCPECQHSFRVTAKLLQQAQGEVRCSACNAAFNAISYLSEDPPSQPSQEQIHGPAESALLETLDRLAGSDDIHIDDTGVEWLVREDLAPPGELDSGGTDAQESFDLPDTGSDAAANHEMRFDDDTPLPDKFEETSQDGAATSAKRRSDDVQDADPAASDNPQEHLELGEPDDWQDLLDEVQEDLPMEVEEELAAIHDELGALPLAEHEDDIAADESTSGDSAETEQQDDGAEESEEYEDTGDAEEPEEHEDTGDAEKDEDAEESGETIAGVPAALLEEGPKFTESIVMEGDTIRSSATPGNDSNEAFAAEIEIPQATEQDYTLQRVQIFGGRRKTDPPGIVLTGGIVILALLMVAQLVHANRQYLSTFGAFDDTAGPIYRLLGHPVTPDWNVNGWQFESTSGATDANDEVLTIYSDIVNRGDQALPYPLVHVSLTDRWEEIIGSRVLQPGAYLASVPDPARLVPPGERFQAAITIASPSPEATGFKLNVCYRVSPGRVRCATGDFKR